MTSSAWDHYVSQYHFPVCLEYLARNCPSDSCANGAHPAIIAHAESGDPIYRLHVSGIFDKNETYIEFRYDLNDLVRIRDRAKENLPLIENFNFNFDLFAQDLFNAQDLLAQDLFNAPTEKPEKPEKRAKRPAERHADEIQAYDSLLNDLDAAINALTEKKDKILCEAVRKLNIRRK